MVCVTRFAAKNGYLAQVRRVKPFLTISWGALALSACAEDGAGGGGEPSCGIEASATGAFSFDQPLTEQACVYSTNVDDGIGVAFAFLREPVSTIALDIDDVARGETGSFPAEVLVVHEDERQFRASGCTVTLDRHEATGETLDDFGDEYRIAGHGTCPDPAPEAGDPQQMLELGPFSFSAPTAWAAS